MTFTLTAVFVVTNEGKKRCQEPRSWHSWEQPGIRNPRSLVYRSLKHAVHFENVVILLEKDNDMRHTSYK